VGVNRIKDRDNGKLWQEHLPQVANKRRVQNALHGYRADM